ncbi:MAG: elongation factor P-like protein YeiP [Kiritimatiellae bacterium]|jgi:elongation factor P|nr:elongation factor P-like protein YeiP [Kiritimatiellia bacterium]MDD4342662.1 elongation factor P-like protein YeiP [Kiritimatiellia bacterium]MDY0149401.1 elongation factor P-like protein YeiP [Kiritimatiellia bacterium]
MIKACDLTKNSVVEINGDPHVVEHLRTQSPSARGAATLYKVRFRNVRTRAKLDQTLKGDDPLKESDFETRMVSYSYREGERFTFMDLEDYTPYELMENDIEEAVPYLVDGMEGIKALLQSGRVVCIQMPDAVELSIAECAPSMRGASVTARTKAATLETGLVIQVPEYMSPGEHVRVDTRTGDFIQRVQ